MLIGWKIHIQYSADVSLRQRGGRVLLAFLRQTAGIVGRCSLIFWIRSAVAGKTVCRGTSPTERIGVGEKRLTRLVRSAYARPVEVV